MLHLIRSMNGIKKNRRLIPQIKEELMAEGWQDVVDEAQRQVDEFMANKN